jgi:uncharacterized membrane protein YgcG
VRPGDGFTDQQRASLARSVTATEQATGLNVVLHVGPLEGGRAGALALLAACGEASEASVVVAVDPSAKGLEIVTGRQAAAVLRDRTCALVALAMTSSFAAGDLVGGIRNGLQVMADHGRNARTVHLDTF